MARIQRNPQLRGFDNSLLSNLWKLAMVFIALALTVFVLDAGFYGPEAPRTASSKLLLRLAADTSTTADQQRHLQSPEVLPRRLPVSFRYADTCHRQSSVMAKPSQNPKLPLAQIQDYANGGYLKIARGSGDVHLIGPLINMLSRTQHNQHIYGTLAELGVHHGRFTGFLFVTARATEKLVVTDLFQELQHLNVDKSGLGDKRRFVQGLSTYGLHQQDLHLILSSSTDVIPFDWADQAGFEAFRMISVDAGHTAALTFNDLQLAFCNLLTGGIVIVDDLFHSTWPGVTEALFQFMAMGPEPEVYPLLSCENKLFLTNDKAAHEMYYQRLLSMGPVVSMYAHEKQRGKLKYEMNGVNYLKCKRGNMTDHDIQSLWKDMVY